MGRGQVDVEFLRKLFGLKLCCQIAEVIFRAASETHILSQTLSLSHISFDLAVGRFSPSDCFIMILGLELLKRVLLFPERSCMLFDCGG